MVEKQRERDKLQEGKKSAGQSHFPAKTVLTFPAVVVYNKFSQGGKEDDACFVRINRRNGIAKWNMGSGKEWPRQTAVRCWPAEGQREENSSPIKKGHLSVAFFCRWGTAVVCGRNRARQSPGLRKKAAGLFCRFI